MGVDFIKTALKVLKERRKSKETVLQKVTFTMNSISLWDYHCNRSKRTLGTYVRPESGGDEMVKIRHVYHLRIHVKLCYGLARQVLKSSVTCDWQAGLSGIGEITGPKF